VIRVQDKENPQISAGSEDVRFGMGVILKSQQVRFLSNGQIGFPIRKMTNPCVNPAPIVIIKRSIRYSGGMT
jgi:hypothetical protein